jgi:hypothetical protein
VIIHDFYVVGIAAAPNKADAPLLVDADAVLALSIALQRFQVITWRRPQIPQFDGDIQLPQLSLGHPFESPKAFDSLPVVKLFGLPRPERLNHLLSVLRFTLNVKRERNNNSAQTLPFV